MKLKCPMPPRSWNRGRYSATHKNPYNLVYRLDPVRAFGLRLVKQIVVAGASASGGANDAYVKVERIDFKNGIKAKLRIHVQTSSGPKEKGVHASASYPTAPGTRMRDLAWGVATCSTDARYEYIHVLKAPASRILELPPPHDGQRYKSARLLKNGREVKLAQNAQTGAVRLTLPPRANWEALDTVIRLKVDVKLRGSKDHKRL